ncbi:MAG: hypothetical protein Q7R92_00440 [bacterium]|nr:hypothetical protein [bacterium]
MENKNNSNELKEAIVKTVAYFDMFDWPLTSLEIWLNLEVKCGLLEMMEALEQKDTRCPLDTECPKNGFYFLAGRSEIILERLRRYNFTDRKFKRALRAARLFKFIPWVKLVAAANLFGDHNLKDGSDIDLFIITAKNRLWISRWFCVGLVKFLRWRPDLAKGIYRDRICLSFFISEAALELSAVRLGQKKNPPCPPLLKGAEQDIHFAHWLIGLKPIYEKEPGIYQKFIFANGWLKQSFPNWRPPIMASRGRIKNGASGFYGDLLEMFLGGLEPQFKKLQIRIMPRRVKELMNQGTNVIVNDEIIKTHVNDRREEYRERYEKKINSLSLRATGGSEAISRTRILTRDCFVAKAPRNDIGL